MKWLIVALLLAIPFNCEAAISNLVQWEVRSTGNDSNGGGFRAGASGTDYSQQDAPQVSTATGANNNSTTFTDSSAPFTSAMVGNIIQVSAASVSVGCPAFPVFREVTAFTNSSTITIDALICTGNSSGMTYRLGGGFATVQKGLTALSIADQWVWIKKGTYNLSVGLTVPTLTAVESGTRIVGYNATHNDNPLVGSGNQPTIASNGAAINILTIAQTGWRIEYLTLDCSGGTAGLRGLLLNSATVVTVYGVKILNCSSQGIIGDGAYIQIFNSEVTGCGGAYAIDVLGNQNTIAGSYIHDNTGGGVKYNLTARVVNNIIANNIGASGDGAVVSAASTVTNNVFYANGRDGLRLEQNAADGQNLWVRNNIFDGNIGYGINITTASITKGGPGIAYNGFRNNTAGNSNANLTLGATNILNASFSGSPFTNAAGADWSLNSTAGAGALLRNAGWPTAALAGLTNPVSSKPDIGVYRHVDPTSSDVNVVSWAGTAVGALASFPTNFSTQAIDASGRVDVSKINGSAINNLISGRVDATLGGVTFPTNFALLTIDANGRIDLSKVNGSAINNLIAGRVDANALASSYRKNIAGQPAFAVYMRQSINTLLGAAGVGPIVQVSKNGAVLGATTGTLTEIGSGLYAFAPSQSDTDCDLCYFLVTASGAVDYPYWIHTR
jgi:hypothetical protein